MLVNEIDGISRPDPVDVALRQAAPFIAQTLLPKNCQRPSRHCRLSPWSHLGGKCARLYVETCVGRGGLLQPDPCS